MRSKILPPAVLALILTLVACSKKTVVEPDKAHVPGEQSGPAWVLSMKSACADGSKEKCLGYYGFSVDATGKYKVGEELASHPTRIRNLSPEELKAIDELVSPYIAALRSDAHPNEKCSP